MSVREPADFEWDKAEAQLAEAAAQDPARTPMAMAHSAYYAGFHAALAVLLLRSKSAPKKHGIVVQQFGLLARSGSEELRQAGRDLHKLKDLRHQADYAAGRPPAWPGMPRRAPLQRRITIWDADSGVVLKS